MSGVAVRPLGAGVGAEISGVDLSRPLDDETFKAVRAAWLDHGVLAFPDQKAMTVDDQITFTRRFGTLVSHHMPQFCVPGQPEVLVVSNVKEDGRPLGQEKAGRNWHTDYQFLAEPASGSFLHAIEVPPDQGDTLFIGMNSVYDALPAETRKRVAGLNVVHSRTQTWPILYPHRPALSPEEAARTPDIVHPLVRSHPETGRQCLYLGDVMWSVEGMDLEEGQALLRELYEFATQDRFVYAYRWRPGDAVLWDNRCTMHCATPFAEETYRRLMYRTTAQGDRPFYAAV
jgi:taurine dioxygenase